MELTNITNKMTKIMSYFNLYDIILNMLFDINNIKMGLIAAQEGHLRPSIILISLA